MDMSMRYDIELIYYSFTTHLFLAELCREKLELWRKEKGYANLPP